MAGFPSLLDNAFKGWIKGDIFSAKDLSSARPLLKFAFPSAAPARADRHDAELATMVESEIIPRLMMAHRERPVAPEASPANRGVGVSWGAEAAEALARLCLAEDDETPIALLGRLVGRGLSPETIYAEVLRPAALRLCDYWDDDTASFADITIGLGRLRQTVRTLGWRTGYNGGEDLAARSILFAPLAGEHPTFGLSLAEETFRWSGWRTWTEALPTSGSMLGAVGAQWFDAVYVNVIGDTPINEVAASVAAIRRASRNPAVFILVSGGLFSDHPERVGDVGADVAASGGPDALISAANAALRRVSDT